MIRGGRATLVVLSASTSTSTSTRTDVGQDAVHLAYRPGNAHESSERPDCRAAADQARRLRPHRRSAHRPTIRFGVMPLPLPAPSAPSPSPSPSPVVSSPQQPSAPQPVPVASVVGQAIRLRERRIALWDDSEAAEWARSSPAILETGETVVVKLLRPDTCTPAFMDRLRLEADSLAVLDHPNIVQVQRFSQTPDGHAYVAMERLFGCTLQQELRERGALPAPEAVDYTVQVLAGLAAAHEHGIVHRDIKPANIFLCDPIEGRRRVKLLDFGLVKTLEDVEASRAPAPLMYPTEEGMFVGTVRYASPEQALTKKVEIYAATFDSRWALCCSPC